MRELWDGVRRRPDGPAAVTADIIRLLSLLCIPIAAIGWGPVGGLSLAFATGGMLLPRALRLRPGFDITFAIVTLIAVWSSVIDLYVTVRWWDLPVHFVLNGLVAAIGYLLLVHFDIVAEARTRSRPVLSTTIVTTALGLSLGVVWEMFEWFGKNFIDGEIYVGYTDSIGDLLWGGLGSLLAGLAMPWIAARPHREGPALDTSPARPTTAAADGPPPRPAD